MAVEPTPVTKQNLHGIARIRNALIYSWQGLRAAWRHESAFREEVGVTIVLVPLALWVGETGLQRAFLIAITLLVLVVELLNSAVEAAVDRISTHQHPLSGRAKDLGSAAVLISIAMAICGWLLLIWERWG